MKAYHVIANEGGWEVSGSTKNRVFKTKESAVTEARKIAVMDKIPIVVHSRDGRVTSVNYNSPKAGKIRVHSAHVKRTLNAKNVRNAIAEVVYSRTRLK